MKKAAFIAAFIFSCAISFAQESTSKKEPSTVTKELAKINAEKLAAKAVDAVDKELGLKKAGSDTLVISDKVKFIQVGDYLIPREAFIKSMPVFLSADAWTAVLEIINSRDYGKIPATTIGQIIQGIAQQLPRKEN